MKTKTEKLSLGTRVVNATVSLHGQIRFGMIITPRGYVKVFSKDGMTSLTCRSNQFAYRRVIKGKPQYTKRGLSTIAHRFIKEVK